MGESGDDAVMRIVTFFIFDLTLLFLFSSGKHAAVSVAECFYKILFQERQQFDPSSIVIFITRTNIFL